MSHRKFKLQKLGVCTFLDNASYFSFHRLEFSYLSHSDCLTGRFLATLCQGMEITNYFQNIFRPLSLPPSCPIDAFLSPLWPFSKSPSVLLLFTCYIQLSCLPICSKLDSPLQLVGFIPSAQLGYSDILGSHEFHSWEQRCIRMDINYCMLCRLWTQEVIRRPDCRWPRCQVG